MAIVESEGGYGIWRAETAFFGHDLDTPARELGVTLVNLCADPSEQKHFRSRGSSQTLPLPVRLLRETDLFVTMPVPKVHTMTGVSLAFKNQWGCIPDDMRLRRHYLFNEAIVAIDKAMQPCVLADGRFFLNDNGPFDGRPVPMSLVIAASDAGTFDCYVCELMRVSWLDIPHLRVAREGRLPATLNDVRHNVPAVTLSLERFQARRTLRSYIALTGFKSGFVMWLGYESWFGRVVLHGILYPFAGRPVAPKPESSRQANNQERSCLTFS